MRFGVLGPLAVFGGEGEAVRVPEAKVRALLAALLMDAPRPVPADRLIDGLWGDRLPANPAGALQLKISRLRKVVGDGVLVHGASGYRLLIEPGALDAHRFEALLARARDTPDPAMRAGLLQEALALWRGPALADFADDEFARLPARRLEEQRLDALEDLAEARLELGEHALLAGELGVLVDVHPLRERLRAVYVRALYRSGRQSEALDSLAELRDRLRDDLGLDPGPELAALQQAILEQDPALDPGPRTNLPARLTDLIGREDAVREVLTLLETERLVTITGPGGVGKTRLAIETASRLTTGAVWLVELAGLTRPTVTEVEQAVAAALGLRDDADLVAALRARPTVLVLDNCEHVVEPVAALVARLLRAVPGLRVLATGQRALAISGEFLWTAPPLEQPSAVRLFVARSGLEPDEADAEAIAAICRRLDGLPLALELAATRVRSMSVQDLAERLDDRFRLLASGRRDAPARQRTLRAMIEWSWQPLSPAERTLLRRLAVHADGCTLQAAEEVCSGAGVRAEDVPDLLARLVDGSLVVLVEGRRYRLLESVAAYCHERLREAGELRRLRQRHHRYYVDLAVRAEQHLRGPEQKEWLERLDAETANLRAALDDLVERGDADRALRLVNALTWYWFVRGRLNEARRLIGLALSIAPEDAPGRPLAMAWEAGMGMLLGDDLDPGVLDLFDADDRAARACARWFLALTQQGYGDQDARRERLHRALSDFRAVGDRWGEAASLVLLATWQLTRGDLAGFRRDGERCMAVFREVGDRWGQLQASQTLGTFAEITGDYAEAGRVHREALRIAEELGLWGEVAGSLAQLGRIALLTGDHTRADRLHERARAMAAERSNVQVEQFAEIGLAIGARRQGRLDTAERHLHRWLDWDRSRKGEPGVALILAELGFIAEQRGDADKALALHTEGLASARAFGDPRAVALALEGLAGAHSLAGRLDRAAALLDEAAALRASTGVPIPQAERFDLDRITSRLEAPRPHPR
ncbi:ATP-binding protein [Spirillospora sp. CA-294931]|uniref:ATP-binding protein n=1 Tax=Spirillospora sp. CA-294931 TaxID=3240042 RepID=UPI003D8DF1CB